MTSPIPKNAVLVGIQLPKISTEELESSLQELGRLVTTLGYKVVGTVSQRRQSDQTASVLGAGKLRELAEWTGGTGEVASMVNVKLNKAALKRLKETEETESITGEIVDEDQTTLTDEERGSAQIVIVDKDLSPSQLRNLETAVGCPVLDRTGVIIEIFSRHARTRAARAQVEIARLKYIAPRMREASIATERQGFGARGGESQLELDRRKIKDRICELKLELVSIENEGKTQRARRSQEACVALVGYTNAGKSSLMRGMTRSEVLVEDKLFATLDTTIRTLYPETRPKILISDTVGFIKKLPHDLVASFKSTLDEALNASLLLFVVDASDPNFRSQIEVTQSVLDEIGTGDIPRLTILNKRDALTIDEVAQLREEFPDAIMISALEKEDLKRLRNEILLYFETDMEDQEIFVPYTANGIVGEIRSKMRVLGESYDEKGVKFQIRAPAALISQIRKKLP